jgi:hypothetical protein
MENTSISIYFYLRQTDDIVKIVIVPESAVSFARSPLKLQTFNIQTLEMTKMKTGFHCHFNSQHQQYVDSIATSVQPPGKFWQKEERDRERKKMLWKSVSIGEELVLLKLSMFFHLLLSSMSLLLVPRKV